MIHKRERGTERVSDLLNVRELVFARTETLVSVWTPKVSKEVTPPHYGTLIQPSDEGTCISFSTGKCTRLLESVRGTRVQPFTQNWSPHQCTVIIK